MNQSMLVIGDFKSSQTRPIQLIDIQDFCFPKLFQEILNADPKKTFLIKTADSAGVFHKIKKDVTFVKAAGGIVKNGIGQYLFIYRLGKWDLPKGKVEAKERYDKTAIREVEEECGIHPVLTKEEPYATYHSYRMAGQVVIKKTKWYTMQVPGTPQATPQIEEDITVAEWYAKEDLQIVKRNTYPLVKELIKEKIEHE